MLKSIYDAKDHSGGISGPCLPLICYRLTFEALEDMAMPAFSGPLWRSVLGPQLKNRGEVLFQKFYKAELPPFVIATGMFEEQQCYSAGDLFDFNLVLFGYANEVSETIIDCFADAAITGLGSDRRKACLVEVSVVSAFEADEGTMKFPEVPGRVHVSLASPMSLKKKRTKELLKADEFHASDLFDKLVRRISSLMYMYADLKLDTDFRYLQRLSENARIKMNNLQRPPRHLKRWSARQSQEVPLEGFIGEFVLDMKGIEELWPYLYLGQWTHVGKNAVMGCGGYGLMRV